MDYKKLLGLLDWIGRMHAILWIWGIGVAVILGVIAIVLSVQPWVIFVLTVAGFCAVIGLALLWQQWRAFQVKPALQPASAVWNPSEGETARERMRDAMRTRLRTISPSLLRIEFDEDGRYVHRGSPEGHGISEGPWLTHKIVTHNSDTMKALQGVEAQIIELTDETGGFPEHLIGHLTLPYLLPFSDSAQSTVALAPNQRKSVDVFAYHRKFRNCHIHLGNKTGTEIYAGTYRIRIQLSSLDTKAVYKLFSIGLTDRTDGFKDPFMKTVQTQEGT